MSSVVAIDIKTLPPRTIGPLTFSWAQPAGRLIWATVLFLVAMGAVMAIVRRPKPEEPPTWAQSMLGAVVVFALMLLAYGTIPHEWLNFANSYLKWNESKFLVHSGQKIGPFHWLNFDINKRAITDTVATLIYVVMLGLNVTLFAMWQKRPTRAEWEAKRARTGDKKVVGESVYGRPVTVKG